MINCQDIDIDSSWIEEFKKNNADYLDFYTEEVTNITLFFIYIDHTKNIEKISRDLMILDKSNIIFHDKLLQLINHKHIYNNNKYKLISLFKYNIDIEPEEIYNFINNDNANANANSQFFIQEKYLNDIIYKNTINIFQDLNSLFFIFKANTPIVKNKKNITKKTLIFSHKNKTRRIQY